MQSSSSLLSWISVAIVLMAVALVGCDGNNNGNGVINGAAIISEATMTTALDDEGRPLDSIDVFPIDAGVFLCSFKVTDIPPDTEITAEWIYIGGEVQNEVGENFLIDSWSSTVRGGTYYTFAIMRRPLPDYQWPRGDYKVDLYADGKKEASALFHVQ